MMKEDLFVQLFFAIVFYLLMYFFIRTINRRLINPNYSDRKQLMQRTKYALIILVTIYSVGLIFQIVTELFVNG